MDIEDVVSDTNDLFSKIDINKLHLYVLSIVEDNPINHNEFEKACLKARRKYKIQPKKALIVHYYRRLLEKNFLIKNGMESSRFTIFV